jgi:hypothetical protein
MDCTSAIRDPKSMVPVSSALKVNGERVLCVALAYSIQVLELDLK